MDASRTLHIRLAPSCSLCVMLTAFHLGGAACVLASDVPSVFGWPAALVVALLGLRCVAVHATGRAGRAIVHLSWDAGGRWRLIQRDGRVLDAVLAHGTYSHPALVALALRSADGGLRRVLVVPDRIDVDCFRRLRVRLRCEGAGAEDDDRRAPLC